jgi:hypothetical protein
MCIFDDENNKKHNSGVGFVNGYDPLEIQINLPEEDSDKKSQNENNDSNVKS